MPKRLPQTECLILGNGPSLNGRDWKSVPRDRVVIFGINMSWRLVPDADYHVAIDHDQFSLMKTDPVQGRQAECLAYYQRLAATGRLFHTGGGEKIGTKLDRHDALEFSRHPFRKRHRGAGSSVPPLNEDGGVALKVAHDSGGSTAYVALQIAAALSDFERFWLVGIDMGADNTKFTGQKSNSEKHDRLWEKVPPDIKSKVFGISPCGSYQFEKVDWPWSRVSAEAVA